MGLNFRKIQPLCFICLLCGLCFVCAGYAAYAEPEGSPAFKLKNPGEMTVSVPELPGFEITIEGVYDTYEYHSPYDGAKEGGDPHVVYPPQYNLYVEEGATVCFNQDVACRAAAGTHYETIELVKDELIFMEEDTKLILFIHEDGIYVNKLWEQNATAAPQILKINIIVADELELVQGELLPIENIRLYKDFLPDPPPTVYYSQPKTVPVAVDGKETLFFPYTAGGEDVFRLRDLAYALNGTDAGFAVQWNAEACAVELARGRAYTPSGREMQLEEKGEKTAEESRVTVWLDGEETGLAGYLIDGHHYFQMEDLAEALDFCVFWDDNPDYPMIYIDTPLPYWFALRGNSAVKRKEVVNFSLGIRAHLGYWDFTASEEGIARELDYGEFIDELSRAWEAAIERGEGDYGTLLEIRELIPGSQPFLFDGEKPGIVELRFVHVDNDPDSAPADPEIREACRIRVFEDNTLAVIARTEGIAYSNEYEFTWPEQ